MTTSFSSIDLFRHPNTADALVGYTDTYYRDFGGAYTAATTPWWGATLSGATLQFARWVIAWHPNSQAGNTSVRLAHADSGGANMTTISEVSDQRDPSLGPIVYGADITSVLQGFINNGTNKYLVYQGKGNGTHGPRLYSSVIDLFWV